VENRFIRSATDSCLFTRSEGADTLLVLVYVDDLVASPGETELDDEVS